MAYERVNWENLPSKNTPVNADNLNKMDEGIANAEVYVGAEEPVAGEKVWFNKDKNSIYVRNSNGVYEEFMKKNEDEIYSTEEIKIGTWIDGKPLYRKVIKVAASSTTQSISLNFSIDKLKSLNGGLDNGNQFIPFGYKDDSNYCSVFIQKNVNSLYFMSSWSSGTLYITLEYTKTTD